MNVPTLRFKDENGRDFPAWEKGAIGAYVDFLSGYPFAGNEITENSNCILLMRGINISEGIIRHNPDIDRYYCGNTDKLQKFFLKVNDLVIGMDGSKVGKNSAIVKGINVNSILVQRVARLRETAISSIHFIFQHINSTYFHSYVDTVKTSSGIPHISAKQIKEFEINFPCLEEQTKIANFLSAIDERIAQLTKQNELLILYKKGAMQQIFSQQLRFKDENGQDFPAWEEKALGYVLKTIIGGGTPSRENPDYYHGSIPWVTVKDLSDDNYKDTTIEHLTELGLKNSASKVIPSYSFIISTRMGLGRGFINKVDMALNQDMKGLIVKKELINTVFLMQWYKHNAVKIQNLGIGSTVKGIDLVTLKAFMLVLPSLPEQTKIANFLSALDEKIAKTREQLEATKLYKKGLLQQLFI